MQSNPIPLVIGAAAGMAGPMIDIPVQAVGDSHHPRPNRLSQKGRWNNGGRAKK